MNTWTKQMGHPVVEVTKMSQTQIKLFQKHYLLDPSTVPEPSSYKYGS